MVRRGGAGAREIAGSGVAGAPAGRSRRKVMAHGGAARTQPGQVGMRKLDSKDDRWTTMRNDALL